MRLDDKLFWIWEFVITFFLSALPLRLYGEDITVIMLIIVSYAIATAIGLLVSFSIKIGLMWLLIFGTSVGAYIIDIALIIAFRLIKMETYPLVVGQLFLLPIYILVSAIMCALGKLIMQNYRNSKTKS